MDKPIVKNLYEFWTHIGQLTHTLKKTTLCSAVSVPHSDWPNRIFDFEVSKLVIDEICQLSHGGELSDIITTQKPNILNDNPNFDFLSGQRNMAIDLRSLEAKSTDTTTIRQVKTDAESIAFAKIASESFRYHVGDHVISTIISQSEQIRVFIYTEENETIGCGIVFFDSDNNAGLHMIGTTPNGRGKGIATTMTRYLLQEAKANGSIYCVLHASLMGEPIYRKLGFTAYGEIETYRIRK
ncbi:GNAT family N-acetyltransferase [Xanthocytophaga agilis]|uniref:GNAT family N-acetyltransferase n=1 Tax=Xanthocytophaga agilis TaxID=3048010 RepID=A0AAE3UEN8_9BACT|nr:GNAT family N-acetyltransferase [Xanthocytophaga agilis]MDJ1501541.1 GNAT family N-acetyltransferase [Xanthocytophaga agilis]